MPTNPFNGLLILDKPPGITSRTAVDRAAAWFPRKTRIGHTGTLDPLATGVLVVCIGTATRLAEYVQALPKTYRAGITLGATSDTDDADGKITPTSDSPTPTHEQVERQLGSFVGNYEQIPPAFSAAKVAGRRAYKLARQGLDVELNPRTVRIDGIDISRYVYPDLEITVRCGKGTYIRSIARDLGQRLGCGGYIRALRRTEVGGFTEADAIGLDADTAKAHARLLPPWRALQIETPMTLAPADLQKLRQGQRIAAPPSAGCVEGRHMAILDDAGQTFAVVELKGGWIHPVKVLASADEP